MDNNSKIQHNHTHHNIIPTHLIQTMDTILKTILMQERVIQEKTNKAQTIHTSIEEIDTQ